MKGMDSFTTHDGRPIQFQVHERAPTEQPPSLDRPWTVHRIEALIEGHVAGFLKISYITKAWAAKSYPTIWHWLSRVRGWSSDLIHAAESGDLDALWLNAHSYVAWRSNPNAVPHEEREADLKQFEAKYTPDFKEFKQYHVNRPLVDFIHVDEAFRRQGVGTALYSYGAQWLAKTKGLPLYASDLQSNEALATWRSMMTRGQLPIRTDRQRRIRMDFRKAVASVTHRYLLRSI